MAISSLVDVLLASIGSQTSWATLARDHLLPARDALDSLQMLLEISREGNHVTPQLEPKCLLGARVSISHVNLLFQLEGAIDLLIHSAAVLAKHFG